jgi:diguanylate cyclase (GGDEF)-like protein
MISLKKYLDMDSSLPNSTEPALDELTSAILKCYRSALQAMGKSGARACPAVSSDLQQGLSSLEAGLRANITTSLIKETEAQVEARLLQWGGCTAEYFKAKTNEVKELLIVLTRTAESMGEQDQRYASEFGNFTTRLQAIADLEDISQIRSSLVQRAHELRTYVDQMKQESQKSVAQLQAEVTTYETKLKAVEQVALRDALTGLANRRKVEESIEWRIEHQQVFCVAMLDLERFKQVNDTYGHIAGDNLLQQFSKELKSNSRSTDIVGRWGGDEGVMILDCELTGAKSQVERIQKWALGEYTIPLGAGATAAKIKVSASIGVTQWQAGQTLPDVIATADSAMYREKALARVQHA